MLGVKSSELCDTERLNSTGGHGGAAIGWIFHYTVIDTSTGGALLALQVDPLA
jgi:hypothetical protein